MTPFIYVLHFHLEVVLKNKNEIIKNLWFMDKKNMFDE